ncbi:D 2 hydroxyglutarate dehydrogenase [Trichuris trichiura]|uniref:D-2-hydroxyglutarate dehydrogenase, mitochondrial n=1 Tax=Trichuris trichiura TaxID=36087 RepID=A0A077ZGF6_TRITR|nr:D 2 hydroxyglutarate dehydrogenase [Trichuris trichiura]
MLERIVGANGLITDADRLSVANTDWTGQFRGNAEIVVVPSSSDEILQVIQLCVAEHLPLCIQGGNTSLVGGSVPVNNELILSTCKLNRILDFDESSGILECEAGCILETLNTYVSQSGYMMPFDLAARGSCMIGGNVATCAGGLHLLRFGPLYGHMLGLEAIVPLEGGQKLNMLSSLRKDNSTLRLTNLFVGSEGQLGIITRLSICTVPRPVTRNVALLGCRTFADCLSLLHLMRIRLGPLLSSVEFMDQDCLDCVEKHLRRQVQLTYKAYFWPSIDIFRIGFLSENEKLNKLLIINDSAVCYQQNSEPNKATCFRLNNPIVTQCPFYMLIETMGFDQDNDDKTTFSAMEQCLLEGHAADGVFAESETQAREIWKLRELISEAFGHDGYNYKYDLSLPMNKYYAIVEECRNIFGSECVRVGAFGHLGDGNIHLNIVTERSSDLLKKRMDNFVYKWTVENNGSISAEHGIGQLKLSFWQMTRPTSVLRQCAAMKRHFDPGWILNPHKTLQNI